MLRLPNATTADGAGASGPCYDHVRRERTMDGVPPQSEDPRAEDPKARARAQFAALVADTETQPPLVETALAIALEEYPALSVRNYLARLHAFSSVLSE